VFPELRCRPASKKREDHGRDASFLVARRPAPDAMVPAGRSMDMRSSGHALLLFLTVLGAGCAKSGPRTDGVPTRRPEPHAQIQVLRA
jgi:hypothetical protein